MKKAVITLRSFSVSRRKKHRQCSLICEIFYTCTRFFRITSELLLIRMDNPNQDKGNSELESKTPPLQNILQKKWRYPRKFPNLMKEINGILIEPEVWKCLRKGKLVKNPIIDAWLELMKDIASNRGLSILPLKSSHYQLLVQYSDDLPIELTQWLWRMNCWSKDVWLFPLVGDGHCSLLIILPKSKVFIFMDGPHKDPPEDLLRQMCGLMESVQGDLDWTQWTFYQPTDYPLQHPTSNNCVIHVCAWCYVLCTGELISCAHEEMGKMRIVIAAMLYRASGIREDFFEGEIGDYEPPVRTSCTTWEDVTWVKAIPEGYSSTLDYCSCIFSREM